MKHLKLSVLMSRLAMLTFATVASASASASASAPSGQKISSFDNQVMTCATPADIGRMSYQLTSATGVIKGGNVEIAIGFETLKCQERGGVFSFEKARLTGRTTNARGGFVELSTLEMVSYTPDLSLARALPVNMGAVEQTVTFIGPVSAFPGLLQRNIEGAGDFRITQMAYLRAKASFGDAKTGAVQTQQLMSFGANSFILSKADGTLSFASVGATGTSGSAVSVDAR